MPRAAEVVAAWRRLPLADLAAITGLRPLLVLAPHPDDETLGCGGLIAEACARGEDVRVVILTDGAGSHPASKAFPPARLAALRQAEARAAAAALGLSEDRITFLDLRDGAAPREGPSFDALAARVAALMTRFGVGTICATWGHDPHPDHLAAHLIAAAAARRAAARHLAYPIWGWALPAATRLPDPALRGARLDISRNLPAKRRAIAAHGSQIGGAITDDPASRVPEKLLANFREPFEVFLEAA